MISEIKRYSESESTKSNILCIQNSLTLPVGNTTQEIFEKATQ